MKKRIRKILCLLLAAVLLLSLAACGKDKEQAETEATEPTKITDPIQLGDYQVVYKGATIQKDLSGKDALVLVVEFTNNSENPIPYNWGVTEIVTQNGQNLEYATIITNPETLETLADEVVAEVAPGETRLIHSPRQLVASTGTVEVKFEDLMETASATIVLDLENLLAPEEATTPTEAVTEPETEAPTEAATEAPTESTTQPEAEQSPLEWWNGPWYGWWTMYNCKGGYEGWDDLRWDVCGTMEIGQDNMGTLILWDEDYTQDDPMANAAVSLSPEGTTTNGTLTSEGGWFTDIALNHADWIVDPGEMAVDHAICISGTYENGEDVFSYEIYLRPWGTIWDEDVVDEDLPGRYYDWYLPLIEAGEEMPKLIPDLA